jgi:hypothetical protein
VDVALWCAVTWLQKELDMDSKQSRAEQNRTEQTQWKKDINDDDDDDDDVHNRTDHLVYRT